MELHGTMLEAHFKVFYASKKRNKVLRMLDMAATYLLKNRQVDLVIIAVYSTLNFYYAWVMALLCRILGTPYIAYLHGGNLPARLQHSPRMSSAIFNHSLANVAPSGYLNAAFEQNGYQARLIPNFIKLEDYPFKERIQFRPRFLWVRSFEQTYHPEMTIRVFAEIQKKHPEAVLCMVGPDNDGSLKKCQQLARELSIQKRVSFMGRLPKEAWVALATDYDIFISTTHFDNTPISVIEAMALGLPVVSTNVGGIPYLLTQLQTGLLSPDNDIPSMVENIQNLLASSDLAHTISRNARLKAESFDWKIVEEQWLNLLNNNL
ncbi:MAG: glycosyltransferase family 4 protein [Saprospiraceae bacterium]